MNQSIKHPNAAVVLQAVALPFAFWFKPICLLIATIWLFYRASQVLHKPLEDLASLLGFDIPSTPVVDLAGIKADGAIIHWSLPDKQKHKSTLKFELQLDGSVLHTLSIHESAATITGLQPACFYVVRVSLVNSIDFASKSEPIRFRTKHASSADYYVSSVHSHDLDNNATHESMPLVRPYRGLKDITPAPSDSVPLSREGSTNTGQRRSFGSARRLSPAGPGVEKRESTWDDQEPPEGAETIQQLTEKLDAIRRETDDAERLAKDEDEEELRQKDDLIKERDELRAEVAEKDKGIRSIKREVSALERQNTLAQTEKLKQDRLFKQKLADRQKVKDDASRWEREAGELDSEVERIRASKAEHLRKAEEDKETLQGQQREEAAAIKTLDEEMKEKNAEIKKVERSIKMLSPNGSDLEPNLVQQLQQDVEERRSWDIHYATLQQQYAASSQKLEQAKRLLAEQAHYLETLHARRRQDEGTQYVSSPPAQERLPRRGDSQRSRRAQSGQSAPESPRLASNFAVSSSAFPPGLTSTASVFANSPFLNIHNGMTISIPPREQPLSDEDRDRLTGGALMSPGAGSEFLPADLFKDSDHKQISESVQPLPGLGSLPGLPGLPGPAPALPSHDQYGAGPASPISASSRSPSVFASPQASQQNLQIGSPENIIDADRRSIRSTRSNRATSNTGGGYGSRFGGMFGIKQRAKTNPLEQGPALGTTQSHSMPRQDQGIPGIDSSPRKRNSSISGSIYSAQEPAAEGSIDAARTSRRKTFNIFGKEKMDGWPTTFTGFARRPVSPRPGSTHSNELPRPSGDVSRWGVDPWPSGDQPGGARSSPLAFGTGWNIPGTQQSRLFGSRHPSRRPSVQYGASAPPEDIIEDDDSDAVAGRGEPYLAPIGTKRPVGAPPTEKSVNEEVPKLNPNAKDFKSFFNMKLRGGVSGSTPSSSTVPNIDGLDNEESPPASRKSRDTRDTRSMTTTESSIAESGRNSVELTRTVSYSNSDAATAPSPLIGGSSAGKESFMSKLTRKSSSGGKFSLPTFKREKGRLDPGSATSTTSTHLEDDEESMSTSLSSLKEHEPRESREGTRGSSRAWSNVLKIGKKKGNETPSLSGLSMASGTEDDEDAEEDTTH